MQQPESILFDFDYTLVDSSRGVIECIRYALDQLGFPPVSNERACQTIGLSLVDTFYSLTGKHDGGPDFARLFVARAEQAMNDGTVLYPTVPGTIATLQHCGIPLGIVSNKYRRRIEDLLRREGLIDAFAVIVGETDVSHHKPAPEGLWVAMTALGIQHALYVGDSLTDAQTAHNAGIPFIATLTGTTPREAFAGLPVACFVQDLSELPAILG
jgi:phosphoglycolate phosphatase